MTFLFSDQGVLTNLRPCDANIVRTLKLVDEMINLAENIFGC